MKLTKRQAETLREIANGRTMLMGRFDRYWWQDSDELCTMVARRLRSKGLIRTVYLNAARDVVQITGAGESELLKHQ
ncbi:hypothetical protein [Escherichia phage M01]|nr:hypothetical protein [Escherichia phage CR01]WKW35329.1 hypothetical protein [Escherichia phage M01]DAG81175.1 MAG TPA: hypothetical protein [Caudoviricetes sp.]